MRPAQQSYLLRILVGGFTLFMIVAVLSPQPIPPTVDDAVLLPMGWLSDGLRNLVLFLPVGATVVASGRTIRKATAIGFLLSLAIELVQIAIPGRVTSPVDVLANTIGAAMGAHLALFGAALLRPTPQSGFRLSLSASGFSIGLLLATAWLLQPIFPETTYYGGWTLDLGHLARYEGRVLEAQVGTFPLASGGPVESVALRQELSAGAPMFFRAIAGNVPTSVDFLEE